MKIEDKLAIALASKQALKDENEGLRTAIDSLTTEAIASADALEQAQPVIDAAIVLYVEWNREPGNSEDDYEALESLCAAVKKYLPQRSEIAGDSDL